MRPEIPNETKHDSSSSRLVLLFGTVLWLVISVAFIAVATAAYHAPLPADLDLVVDIQELTAEGAEHDHWQIMHILAPDCGCSERLAGLLAERGAFADEVIMVAGEAAGSYQQLAASGFVVSQIAPADLSDRYGVYGGPWLLVSKNDDLVYSGGHGKHRPRSAAQLADRLILKNLQLGQTVLAYPSFGCATNEDLQAQLDPFSWK